MTRGYNGNSQGKEKKERRKKTPLKSEFLLRDSPLNSRVPQSPASDVKSKWMLTASTVALLTFK